MNQPKALTPDERAMLRVRIRKAREDRSVLAMSPNEIERILDAYEAMCLANTRLLDKADPPQRTT